MTSASLVRWRSHQICPECWLETHPDREPVSVLRAKWTRCIWCEADTCSGIFVRVRVELPVSAEVAEETPLLPQDQP